ncbi:hypothetical protein P7H20_00025 [Paenibacillus larvae]|nr:hypothetical protein [Paenibacillus larvae]MDT2273600.1 hypothetical protein [Paenibacillus larvae]
MPATETIQKDYDIQMNETADMLIHHPNSNMSGFEWLNKMEVSRNETGNGYAVIMRTGCSLRP